MSTHGGSGGGGLGPDAFPLYIAQFGLGGTAADTYVFEQNTYLSAAATPVGEVEGTVTSVPTLVAPSGLVAGSPTLDIDGLDTTTDDLGLNAHLWVTNLLGTEVLELVASGDIAQSGPGQSGDIDWTTATANAVAGSDLSWDGSSTVTSTAGGVFVVSLVFTMNWD